MSLRINGTIRGFGFIGLGVYFLTTIAPAFAHHPFAMAEGGEMNVIQGLLSGIAHPLLGPDHLLFLLAIGFLGLKRPFVWILPLLAFALGGAALTQVLPLSSGLEPAAEALVSLSLVVEGLIALNIISAGLCDFILPSNSY